MQTCKTPIKFTEKRQCLTNNNLDARHKYTDKDQDSSILSLNNNSRQYEPLETPNSMFMKAKYAKNDKFNMANKKRRYGRPIIHELKQIPP